MNLMDVGRLYTGLSLDYGLRLWASTSASRVISAVAELLVNGIDKWIQQAKWSRKGSSHDKAIVTFDAAATVVTFFKNSIIKQGCKFSGNLICPEIFRNFPEISGNISKRLEVIMSIIFIRVR